MASLKVLELFGGIGACTKALERLNIDHEVVDYVEIDKYAVKSFNAVHGTNFAPQDITKWDKDIKVDLIMHGSPCQDFSVAGLGKGGDEGSGTRSSLMYETLRIVEKLKPKYVIWENVKNLLSKKHRHNFDAYLEAMEKIGYKNYYQVLNAKDYGIPQNRERVFTVSILNGENFVFPKPEECNSEIEKIDIEQQVSVRKYPVDIENLKKTLRANKNLTNNQIAERLSIPVTKVEHWFRNDGSFAIPDKDTWYKLKDLLKIETNEFDESITTFETKENIFEKSNRCYFDSGLAPTITSSGADEKIIETNFSFPQKQELKIRLKDILEDSVDERYYISKAMMDYFMGVNQKPSKFPRKERFLANINRKDQDRANSITTAPGQRPTDNFVKEPFCVASRGRGENNEQHLEPRKDGNTNTITSVQKDNYVATPYRIRKLTPKDFMWYNGVYEERYKESREILQILQQKIGEEAFCEWAIRGLWCILSESVLWERVYAKGIFENWVKRPELVKFAYFGENIQPTIPTQEQVRNMWVNWQDRYPSYRWELSEQQFRQLKSVVQKLPHQVASFQGFVQGLWETYEGTGLLRQALSEIQKIWGSDACWEVQWTDYRIRKLTPLSCWRLMGFDDSDFDKAAKVNSNTQLYKQAGNSIVVNVLEAIFRNLL